MILQKRYRLIILFTIICSAGLSQSSESAPGDTLSEILSFSRDKYGIDQLLIHGRYHEYQYRHAIGHPFFGENIFLKGELNLLDKEYADLSLKYDIYTHELIINAGLGKQEASFYPPAEFVKSFTFSEKRFENRTYQDEAPAYYQIIADEEEIACLYYWFKTREESDHNITFSSYKFSEDKVRRYLVINNNLLQYRNNRSFKKLFPEHLQSKLNTYLRSGKLSVKKASDEEMNDLITYCHTLLKDLQVQ